MKDILQKTLFLFLFTRFSSAVFAQTDSVFYFFDDNEDRCTKERAVFVAKGIKENNKIKLSYFIRSSGIKIMQVTYTDTTLRTRDGEYFLQHETGYMMKNGRYTNGKEEGYWLYWDEKHLTDSVLYEDGKDIIRISYAYYSNGVLYTRTLNDSRTKTTEFTSYDKDGNLERNTNWVNGTGDQIYYYPDGKIKKLEEYKKKKMVSVAYFKPDGSKMKEKEFRKTEEKDNASNKKAADEVTATPGMPPSYPGGSTGFMSFFQRNFKAPESLRGMSQRVTVTFFLDKAGFAYDIRVTGSSDRNVEIEVLTVFRRMAAWTMNGYKSYGPITYTIEL